MEHSVKQVLRTRLSNWLTVLATLVLLIFLMSGAAFAEDQEPVKYMDWENGQLVEKTCTDYTVVDVRTIWEEGGMRDDRWYVVKGDVTFDASGPYDGRINIINSANLILMDGCTLRANKGIKVCIDRSGDEVVNTLTIYGQKEGTGRLNAIATDSHAAIGGNGVRDVGSTIFCDAGNVIINGGDIYAEGNASAPGIGGGEHGKGGNVVINHGRLNAKGFTYSSGRILPAIGAGYKSSDEEHDPEDEGSVSINEDLAVVAGDSENALTDVTDSYPESHYQCYVYIGEPADHTVTFKVRNGKWNDKTTDDKTFSFRTCKGVAVKIPADEFPDVGNEPDTHYKKEGAWAPSQDTVTSEDKTYIYYYSYEDGASAIVSGADVLGKGANTAGAPTVMYGGNSWRVIGYKGAGAVSEEDNMTLLASGHIGQTLFAQDNNNAYAVSDLKAAVDEIADALSNEEKTAVAKRTLTAGQYAGSETDCIVGDPVSNALMWPLSTKEAYSVCKDIRVVDPVHPNQNNSRWWLRSPGERNNVDAGMVYGSGDIDERGFHVTLTNGGAGVRPAFNLNTGSVLFASSAEGGKSSGETGSDALAQVSEASGNSWKLTLKDNNRSGFSAQPKSVTDDSITVGYSGAATGENEYISAIVEDSEGYIKYYGRIKSCAAGEDASGTVTINTKGKLEENDALYVFNEQFNGDNQTDYASDLVHCAMEYTWAEDYSSVTAMCTLPDGTVATETVQTTSKVTTAPHCEREGQTTYTAEFTNPAFETQTKTVTNIPAYGHDWGTATYTWSADNSSVTARRVCRRDPTHIEGETIGTTSETKAAACEEKGETTYMAVFHKEAFTPQIKVVYTDALGHTWSSWNINKEPTENDAGEQTRECSVCHKVDTMIIPPTGHVNHTLEHKDDVAASCEESGHEEYYECTVCGAWFRDEDGTTQVSGYDILIPATGHNKITEKGEATEPTCDSAGGYSLTIKCETCEQVLDVQHVTIPPLGHDWGEWVVTREATESEEGEKTRTCSRCEASETEAIPKIGPVPAPSSDSAAAASSASEVLDPSLPKVKNIKPVKGKASIKAKWKKLSKKNRKKVQGIEIQYSTSKAFPDGQTGIAGAKKTAKVKKIKKLARKTTYYTRVRTYKYVDGVKHVSNWSAVKKNKTK